MGCTTCGQARAKVYEAARNAAKGKMSAARRNVAESAALVARKFADEASRVRERLTRR